MDPPMETAPLPDLPLDNHHPAAIRSAEQEEENFFNPNGSRSGKPPMSSSPHVGHVLNSLGPPPLRKLPVLGDMGPPPPISKAPAPRQASLGEMKAMGPPPPRVSSEEKKAMGPPPRKIPLAVSQGVDSSVQVVDLAMTEVQSAEKPEGKEGILEALDAAAAPEVDTEVETKLNNVGCPDSGEPRVESAPGLQIANDRVSRDPNQPLYEKPSWSAPPGKPFSLEILKEGISLGTVDVSKKGAYMFGRSDRCDFVLEHPTVSRYHAVLQYNAKGNASVFDLGSTHGTFINKCQVKEKAYAPLNVGDIIRFGHSSRLHIFQGPLELMPQEGLTRMERLALRQLEAAQERAEKESSILRARRDAISAEGASWGMQEDAEEEEDEAEVEEVTWQTFKGELTEKQQKTLEKVHKRHEKLANLKKENDAIQAKEISQGGLTQGQQTQIARNEQRMEQLVEELESMEETLNESIQESINGRSRKGTRGKKSAFQDDDEDEDLSDDEFYDRASKQQSRKKKDMIQIVETAETLLDKKAVLDKEIGDVRSEIKLEEEQNVNSNKEMGLVKTEMESEDPLDQYMTNLSSKIVQDRAFQLQKELESRIKEAERVSRLLKIADPTGEALEKWKQKQSSEVPPIAVDLQRKIGRRVLSREEDAQELASVALDETKGSQSSVAASNAEDSARENTTKGISPVEETPEYRPLDPPIRLGAPPTQEESEETKKPSDVVVEGAAPFVSYKDRKKGKDKTSGDRSKLNEVVRSREIPERGEERKEATTVDSHVADSVALLLKHKRGLTDTHTEAIASDDLAAKREEKQTLKKSEKSKKKQKLGPAKSPDFNNAEDAEIWVPPAGQTGDGRTALNDKYGY